jgi:hypothetical protein
MTDPKTMGSIGMGATAGGSILGAFGSIGSGMANKGMYDYQASLAKLNAQILRQDADFAMQTGEQENMKQGFRAGQEMGHIKTAQAASGFDVRTGSNLQVQQSKEMLERIDTSMIRSNAAKTAYNYDIQAWGQDNQANLYKAAGNNAMTAGIIGAGSSILGGVSSVGMWGGGGSGGGSGGIGSDYVASGKNNVWGA